MLKVLFFRFYGNIILSCSKPAEKKKKKKEKKKERKEKTGKSNLVSQSMAANHISRSLQSRS